MALGAAPGGLPPVGAQAVLLGMQQFNQSVRQVSTGLGQINGASLALERNSVLATTRMTSAFASLSSAYVTGGARMVTTLGLMQGGIAGVAVAALAIGANAVASAASFEKAMAPVRVFGDLSKQQTDQLSDSVLRMSRTWGAAANAIAAGEEALVKAGASFNDLNGPLSEAVVLLNVNSKGELDMAESADIVTQGMRSWKLSTAEAIPFVNALVGATNASTAGFKGMATGLGQSQAMAAALGISYRDLFAMLGILNDENIRGERAGTAIRNLWLRMLNPAKDVAGVMLRYSISMSDANGNMIEGRELVQRLAGAFSEQATAARGLTRAQVDADLATLGMSRSLLGALALANQGTAAFDKYQRAMDKVDARKIAEALTANTVKQAEIFFRNISAIATAFGGPFNESLGRAINSMNKWLQTINLAQVKAIATIIRDQLGGALNYVSGLVSKGIGAVSSILGGSNIGSTAGNAVLGVITGIIVKVQQAQTIWNAIWNNPNVGAGATSLLNTLAKLADAVLPRVQLAMATIGEILVYVIPRAIAAIPWDTLATTAETAVDETVKFLDGGYKQVAQDIYDNVVSVVNGVLSAVNAAISGVSTAASGVINAVSETVKGIVNAILNTLGAIVEGTANFLDPFAQNFSALLEFVLDAVHRTVRAVGRAFEPLNTFMSSDVPQSFGPLFEVLKTVIAVGIVVERTWIKLVGNIIKYSYEGWAKAVPLSIDDALSAIWRFVRQTGSTIQAAISVLEFLADATRGFSLVFTDYMRSSAQAVSDFGEFVINAFTSVFKWLENQPVIGAFFKDLHDQFDQAKLSIDNLFKGVASAPVDAFTGIRNSIDKVMSGIDMTVQDVRKTVDDVIGSVGDTVSGLGSAMQQAFDEAKGVVAGILPTLTNAGEGVRKFLEAMIDSARNRINSATPEAQKFLKTVQDILANVAAIPASGIGSGAVPGKLPGSNRPETEGVGFPVDQAKQMQQYVASLLRGIPALTDEFTEFVAKLVEADPNRLQGIVAALSAQRGVLQDIGRVRLEILQTEIKIAEVDAKLDDIHRQQQRIQIQMQQASLPFEQQLLALRTRSMQIEQQMLPLQNAIAGIDQQIALLQRENLGLRMRELLIRQQMMPIENAIADIDKRIADTQKVNYEWAIRSAQIQLQMLPIQNAIEDIEKQIAKNNQENYELTRQRLQLEQAALPIRRAIEDIDKRIALAQARDFEREAEELRLQGEVLDAHQEMAQIDRVIASYNQTNYGIVKQLADLDKQALPYKQQIARLEQQITDIVDKRAQLERDRASLIAEHDLKSTERAIKQIDTQLDALWKKFSSTKGVDRSALIPKIIDLEQQKKDLQEALKPAQALVDTLKEQQDEINYNNELTKIGLQIQEAEQEALLAPINAQIDALKRQQEQEEATNAVIIAILNQQKAAIQANIAEQEEQLALLRELAEVQEHAAKVAVLGLEREKAALQTTLDRYEDQLKIIQRIEEENKLAADIANTFLEEQAQRLKTILERYSDELTAIQRAQQAYDLRNSIVRLGLEQEKSRLEALLRVWQDQLTAIERERAAEELRNQIAITGLEAQKRNLENLLTPLENAKRAIEHQTAAITLQQQLALVAYQEQLLKLQAIENENTLYKNQLEALRAAEQTRLSALIQGFMNALINSGAFTSGEVIESVKRLNLWQGEVDKLTELRVSYTNLQTQLSNTTAYGNAQTAMNNLNNVIPGLSASLNGMSTNASSAFTNVNNLANAFNGATTPTTTMYNGINSLAAVFNTMQSWAQVAREKVDNFRQALTDSGPKIDNEITQVNNLTSSFNALTASITNAAGALSQYGTVAAKNIATEATAAILAEAFFNQARSTGAGYEQAARHAYGSVVDFLNRRIIGYAEGGFVGGALNAPQMAIVHGGEYVVSRPEQRQLTAAITRAMTTYNQQQTTVNYNFSASYERQQDPITASMDMRALIEMTR